MQVTLILDFGYLINAFCVSSLHIKKKSRTNGEKWSYILKMFVKKNKFKLNKEKEIFFSEWDFVNNMACKSWVSFVVRVRHLTISALLFAGSQILNVMRYACLSFRQQAWSVERVHLAFEQVVLLALCSADYTTAPAQGISLEKKKRKKKKLNWVFISLHSLCSMSKVTSEPFKTENNNYNSVDHFRITGLFFKASPGAHPFIWKLILIHMQMKTNFHMKGWAPGLALKKRPKVIRKWPILRPLANIIREQ